MNRVSRLVRRLRALTSRASVERELDDELRFHIEMQTEQNLRQGMSREEAHRQAVLGFGGVEGHKEASRQVRGASALDAMSTDTRFALRYFRRTPLLTITIVLVLSVGLGAAAGVFTFTRSARTLPPPGLPRDDALVWIRPLQLPRGPEAEGPISTREGVSASELAEYAKQTNLFAAVGGEAGMGGGHADFGDGRVYVNLVNPAGDYFEALGIQPILGGWIASDSGTSGDPLVAVVSESIWKRYYGGRTDIIGTKVILNKWTDPGTKPGTAFTIVGVAPARFRGVRTRTSHEWTIWIPAAARPIILGDPALRLSGASNLFGRLRPGVTPEQATGVLRTIAARSAEFRRPGYDPSADVVPLRSWNQDYESSRQRVQYSAAFKPSVAILILLITCTNVSGLLAASAIGRRREIAARIALGATRARLVRQLLTEGALLAGFGGLLGIGVLWLFLRGAGGVVGSDEYGYSGLQVILEWQTVAFVFGCGVLAAIAFGLTPALHATRLSVGEVLKDSAMAVSGSRLRLHRWFVIAQVALTQPLLVGLGTAVLVIAGDWGLRRTVDEHVAAVELARSDRPQEARHADLYGLAERYRAIPGVTAAIVQENYPDVWTLELDPADNPANRPELRTSLETAPPGYFAMLERAVVRGRDFNESDRDLPVRSVIVTTDLAREVWGEADPVGRRLKRPLRGSFAGLLPFEEVTVVGVVDGPAEKEGRPLVFLPVPDDAEGRVAFSSILVRTVDPAASMIPSLVAIAKEEGGQLNVANVATLAEKDKERRLELLLASRSAAAGGILAVLLAAIGLYALVSFSARQRSREIGIRAALGAGSLQLTGIFVAMGLKLALIGLAIGLPVSLLGFAVLEPGTGDFAADPLSLSLLTTAIVVMTTAFAVWLPARRASRVDPIVTLRSE